ncbi:Lrp/AsnC family transcriptional regulator [archaeon]|nr:Lrp/AsnC family transcriptional regulator [archaeon]
MENTIDAKDRKILLELDRNARKSDSEIAKKTNLSKQVVNYRINKLLEKKIISNFYTIVNVGALGLNSYYIFLQLEKINKLKEKRLLNKLNSLPYTGWLVSGTGKWDAVLLIYADTIKKFDERLNEVINLCGKYLHDYNFTTLIGSEHISYKFLAETRELHSVKQTEKMKLITLDEKDKKILEVISQNARMPITEISKKVDLPVHVVNYRLKSLIKQKIIEGFKPKIDVNKLGYQWHLLLIQFQNTTKERKKQFIEYCKNHKNIYYVTNTVGLYNLMLDIHVNDVRDFKEVLLDLKDNFSDVIKLYESLIIFDEYKISYLF